MNSFPLYQGLVGKNSINELRTGWQDSILAMSETITRKYLPPSMFREEK
jgi:hypothetical protein